MASGRMFSREFVDGDLFAFLTIKGQCLYFHLAMSADDEGYVSSARRIMRSLNLNDEVLSELKANGLVYEFSSGVCLMMHWHRNNQISPTKRKPTTFVNEKAQVRLGYDKVYYINPNQPVPSLAAQERKGEVSSGEVSSAEASAGELSSGQASSAEESVGEGNGNSHTLIRCGICQNVIITVENYNKLAELYPDDYDKKIDKLSTYMASHGKKFKDHFATIIKWAIEDECANNKAQKSDGGYSSDNIFKRLLENGEINND